jgi:hypothetical protein
MRSFGVMFWFLLACVLSCNRELMAQDLQVLVLDALNGKPQANVKVEYSCVGPPRNSASKRTITDNDGFAKISNFCSEKQQVEISVYPPNKKEQCGDDTIMNFSDVLLMGFVSKPDSAGGLGGIGCPTKVSGKLKPVPGQVIIFVKKPTWLQSHVAG